MRKLSVFFWILAVFLSDYMSAVVAYNYCDLQWDGKYAGYSVPASTAFLSGIRFALGIIACIVLAIVCGKKAIKADRRD